MKGETIGHQPVRGGSSGAGNRRTQRGKGKGAISRHAGGGKRKKKTFRNAIPANSPDHSKERAPDSTMLKLSKARSGILGVSPSIGGYQWEREVERKKKRKVRGMSVCPYARRGRKELNIMDRTSGRERTKRSVEKYQLVRPLC